MDYEGKFFQYQGHNYTTNVQAKNKRVHLRLNKLR
jgi:hypothetical protein